jgi:hypothetical protein
MIAGAILLSPVLAFLLAIVVEIAIGAVKEGGLPALVMLVSAGIFSRLFFRKVWKRPDASALVRH